MWTSSFLISEQQFREMQQNSAAHIVCTHPSLPWTQCTLPYNHVINASAICFPRKSELSWPHAIISVFPEIKDGHVTREINYTSLSSDHPLNYLIISVLFPNSCHLGMQFSYRCWRSSNGEQWHGSAKVLQSPRLPGDLRKSRFTFIQQAAGDQ